MHGLSVHSFITVQQFTNSKRVETVDLAVAAALAVVVKIVFSFIVVVFASTM